MDASEILIEDMSNNTYIEDMSNNTFDKYMSNKAPRALGRYLLSFFKLSR